ncbi:MAG: hypothetical protein DRG09_05915 [Epsilonproteobacteria bacterium]|nr:MAG: hypothetical protein DRG09_05915 [Campylobacterota bacterium]
MNITYKLSPEEYLQVVNFHHKKSHRVLKLTVYIVLAAIIVIFSTDFSNTREIITNILTAFFSISFYMLFVRMLSAFQAKNIYTKSPTLPYEITLRISGKGIRLDKNGSEKTIPWSAFSTWKKEERFYLLYTSPRQFNAIPTRVMSDIQINELDGYLKKYIPQD